MELKRVERFSFSGLRIDLAFFANPTAELVSTHVGSNKTGTVQLAFYSILLLILLKLRTTSGQLTVVTVTQTCDHPFIVPPPLFLLLQT